ncbi:hypothetical protein MtrunA17_Chr5g0442571 [Medicago truncatula]|uniref:Uncharacterized protein n=1 Tax=Medicago truncatula TaxID=3880 RepID=A0A396HYR1_MEDTR|nr:hypothetical protein MtrunA17_Chr5g0442571 [Medicago truncatula]
MQMRLHIVTGKHQCNNSRMPSGHIHYPEQSQKVSTISLSFSA